MSDLFGFTPTNSLASVSFDVLNVADVEDPLINVEKLADIDISECYFAAAVDFINECNADYTNAKKVLYAKLSEAANTTVVLESFSDFYVQTKAIIDKFLKFIKNMFDRFIITMSRMVDSDKYLKSHKKDLEKYKNNHISVLGYNYTFSDNIPNATVALEFTNSLFDKLYVADSKGELSIQDLRSAMASFGLEEDYACFRAKVIGKPGEKILLSEYSDELFKVYRDGQRQVEDVDCQVGKITERYFNNAKMKAYCNSQYRMVENAYKKVISQIQDICKRNGDLNAQAFVNGIPSTYGINGVKDQDLVGLKMSAEIMSQVDIYVKSKIDQIQGYSNIHTLAYAAKLDALKECAIQDRNALYAVLSTASKINESAEDDEDHKHTRTGGLDSLNKLSKGGEEADKEIEKFKDDWDLPINLSF